jgi:CHAD domain-containing protein
VNRVLELVQERRVYDVLTQEGARLEVSADRAEIAGTDHVLQRIEVEGAPGDKEALARWAAKLRRRLRLKPARKSKFERGLLAIGLRLPDPADAPALRLRAGDTVRRAAARTSSRYFRRMQWYLPGTRLGLDPEYLHQMRVCVRRLRAVLRLFRSALPPAATSALAGELRWLGHSLGAVRDLDVLLRRCDAETRASSGAACRAADACRHEMSRRRDKAYAALRRDLAGARFRALAKMCRSYVARLRCPVVGGGGKVAELGARAMRSELRKILRDGRTITAETPAPVLHRLRIRCKRLRYACDLLSEIHGKPVARMSRRIGKLQEVLGAYQDAVSAQVLLARAAEEAPDTPARADIVAGLERCAAGWHREQAIRRTAFPEAWARFDRKKARQAFLKALRGGKPAVRG